MRVDTAVYAEGVVPPYYDSLVAKLIVHGKDREEAIQRMKRALSMFVVEGIHTSIPLHLRILSDPRFIAGDLNTHFLNSYFPTTGRCGCRLAVASVPPNPIVSTAEEGTITIEPFSFIASYSMFIARRCSAVGLFS